MNCRTFAVMVLAAALALPAAARADMVGAPPDNGSGSDARSGAAGHFSAITGETVAAGQDMVTAELGFPGFSFGYAHGVTDRFDVGAALDLLYGFRNTTLYNQFGMQLRVPLRYIVYRRGQVAVQIHADPGLDFYTAPGCSANYNYNYYSCQGGRLSSGPSSFGINVPVGVTVGFQATPALRLALGADLPIDLNYSPSAYLQTGPMFGGGLEFFFDKQWSAGFNFRVGPQFFTVGDSTAQAGFVTQATVAYRL